MSTLEKARQLLDQASMRAADFANGMIRVVRRDESEAILRDALVDLATRCRVAVAHDARMREREVDSDKYAHHYKVVLKSEAERAGKLLDDVDAIIASTSGALLTEPHDLAAHNRHAEHCDYCSEINASPCDGCSPERACFNLSEPCQKGQRVTITGHDFQADHRDDAATKQAIFDKLVRFFKEHTCFSGESYYQSDGPQIGSQELMGELLDILDFKVIYR